MQQALFDLDAFDAQTEETSLQVPTDRACLEAVNNETYFDPEYIAPLLLVDAISKKPRYYQANAALEVAKALQDGHQRVCVKSPTGTGKTLISKLVALSLEVRQAANLPEAVQKGEEKLRILYIANKHRLNRQAVEEYAENKGIELIVHSAFSAIPDDVIEQGWHMAFIDECHHEAMMSIQYLLKDLSGRPVIGFTAEDKRGDGLVIKFSKMITAISEREACERGFIEKAGVNSIIDFSGTNKLPVAKRVMEKYHGHMGNAIMFFRTEKEVIGMAKFLRRLGISAVALDSKANEAEVDRQLERLSAGEIQVIVNCQRIGEGVDTPNVFDVFLFRSFNSFAEKKQYVGRAIRPDSPCSVWELINPLADTIQAKDVVGMTKYERVIYLNEDDELVEEMVSGVDPTWGRLSELRFDIPTIRELEREAQQAKQVAA